MDDSGQIREILERLARVEQQNTRLKRGGISLVVIACCFLVGAQAAPRARTVEAERFILRDANGKVSAYLGPSGPPTQPGPVLILYAEPGQPGAQLTTGQSGSALRISDRQGFEAVFGNESLIDPITGEKTATSAASLIFYGKDKGVIWKAPGS